MYWFSKLYKTQIEVGFIIVSKNCSTKSLSGVISKIFEMLFKHVESFHNKSTLYSKYKNLWVVENFFPKIEKLNIINTRKRAKNISAYDFSILYTTIHHNLLIRFLSETIHFVFKSKVRWKTGFFSNFFILDSQMPRQKILYGKKSDWGYYIVHQNLLFYYWKYGVQIRYWDPYGHWPCSFLNKSVSLFFESKHAQNHISKKSTRAYKYHGFIDDLCAINDDEKSSKSFKWIYPGELVLKLEHSETHATFLDLHIKIGDGIFADKLFDRREKFQFFIVHMPHCESNILSNLHQ